MSVSICAYTSICEEDSIWVRQYLAEAKWLKMPFAINFDRCSTKTIARVLKSPLCVGHTQQDDPAREFTEMDKQGAFDIAAKNADWTMAWDIDETWEHKFPKIVKKLSGLSECDTIDCPWVNLWGDKRHIRIDGVFKGGHRVKFYNIRKRPRWHFDHPITNGAKFLDGGEYVPGGLDVTCIHWGMMTRELRDQHKARWDRIYTTAVGANPYGFWNYAVDEEAYPPVVVEHDLL